MKLPRVPEILVGGLAALPELFRASAKWRGLSRNQVEEVIRLVPGPIIDQVCFLDRLTGLWRYDYGEPFDNLAGDQVVLGTTMFHEVDRLFDVINCARTRLQASDLNNYLRRLSDPSRHQDGLFEFAPILRLIPMAEVDYETAGYGEGNYRIDWLIRGGPVPLLLEVKNRTRDLLESLNRIQLGERDADGRAPAPAHDPAILFRSVEPKFKRRSSSEIIQAVWITTSLKQEESELVASFAQLDPERVHVALLGDFEDDVYVLANDLSAKERILQLLQVRESRRALFQRGTNPTVTQTGHFTADAGASPRPTSSSSWAIWFGHRSAR